MPTVLDIPAPPAPTRAAESVPVLPVHLLRACDGLAAAVAQYAVPVLVYQLTASVGWAGVAFAIEWMPRLAAVAVGGPLVDRADPRAVMVVVALGRALVVMVGLAALAGGAGAVAVISIGVFCGALAELGYVAAESLGAAAGRGADAAQVQAVQTAIDQGAVLLGPLLGGVLLLTGPYVGLGAVGGLSLAAVIVAAAVRLPPCAERGISSAGRAGMVHGLQRGAAALRALPMLCWMIAALAAMNLLSAVLQAATPVLVAAWGRSPAATGAVWSLSAGACLLAAAVSARMLPRVGPARMTVGACAAGAMAAAAAGLAPCYAAYTAALALLAAAEGAALVALRTARAQLLPDAVFGSAVAVTVLVLLSPMPLGGVLLALVPTGRLPVLLVSAALAQGAVTLVTARALRRHVHGAVGRSAAAGADPVPYRERPRVSCGAADGQDRGREAELL